MGLLFVADHVGYYFRSAKALIVETQGCISAHTAWQIGASHASNNLHHSYRPLIGARGQRTEGSILSG